MSAIAKKHIEISIKTKQIAKSNCEDCRVYIATYTAGRSGQSHQPIEVHSGEEFWSIKAWTPSPHHHLKDPDVIITQGERVKFLVEVKWGTVPGRASTDLLMSPKEWAKLSQLLQTKEFICRVRGPAVRHKRRYKNTDFQITEDYKRDSKSKLVLVTDFVAMKQELTPKFQRFLESWKRTSPRFLIADINTRVGEIPSIQEILQAQG